MKKILIPALVPIIFSSCQKKDTVLERSFVYDMIGLVDMGSENGVDYRKQLYFDLSSGELKAENIRDVWDLALSCEKGKPNLFVNPSTLAAIAATGSTDFNAVFNTSDYNFKYERADRFYTHGRITDDFQGTGKPEGEVFIIDLGRNLQNQKRGYKLLQVTAYSEGTYSFKIADLNHNNLKEVQVQTDATYNFVFISLDDPENVLTLEPPKNEWDLHFTKYMERLYDGTDTLDYSVTGCMINPWRTEAYFDEESYLDSTLNYHRLTLDDIDESLFSIQQNVIGHEWKYYDLDAGAYSVITRKNYFIKDSEGIYYRLHFTGFYDNSGNKGAVTFEYLPL